MAYEIPYDSNYGEWYGIPQNVTRLSAVLEQTLDEDGNSIGLITASWDMPDNGGTFVAQLSTDGTTFYVAETNIRNNRVVLVVPANTDYYLKIITVLGVSQSSGTTSSLMSASVTEVPSTPTVTAVQGGMQINVGAIPVGYRVEITINDGTDDVVLYATEMITTYICDAGTYSVSTAYVNASNDVGTSSTSASVTVNELAVASDFVEKTSADYIKTASVSGDTLTLVKGNDTTVEFGVYNLKTPKIGQYELVDNGTAYYVATAEEVILDNASGPTRKSNSTPALRGYYNSGGNWTVPILMSLIADGVTMHRGGSGATTDTETYDGVYHDTQRNLDWYYNTYSSNLNHWGSWTVAVDTPLLNNGTSMNVTQACASLLAEANPALVPTDSVEDNLFYPTDVTLSSGDTITDTNLKSLIAYHRPITINGTIYTPSDLSNDGTYTYYALQNGSNSTEIKKAQINSSWVITITTESTGGSGSGDVTTNTDQNITGTKTFVGQKKILFKQSANTDKLGFTLYTNSDVEKGYLEYNPSNTVDSVPLMTIGNYATASAGLTHVGFRKYSEISGASGAYNLLAPLISDARSPFNLTTTYQNFYFPLGITNGTTTVKTAKSGLLDISSLLPSLPIASANTLGGIKVGNNLSIDANGVLSASGGGGGGGSYTAGDGIDITNDTISLETASANDLGGIKVGDGLSIDNDGVLSTIGGGGGNASGVVVETIYMGNDSMLAVNDELNLSKSWKDYDVLEFVFFVKGNTLADSNPYGVERFVTTKSIQDCYSANQYFRIALFANDLGSDSRLVSLRVPSETQFVVNTNGGNNQSLNIKYINGIKFSKNLTEQMYSNVLYENASGWSSGNITLNDSLDNYDFICFNYAKASDSANYMQQEIIRAEHLYDRIGKRYSLVGNGTRYFDFTIYSKTQLNYVGSYDHTCYKIIGIKMAQGGYSGIVTDARMTVKSGHATFPSKLNNNSGASLDIVFDSPMPDTNYYVLLTASYAGSGWANTQDKIANKTVNGFTITLWTQWGSTENPPEYEWIAIRPNSYTREGMAEDVLFSNASGVNSGDIALSGNISDYDLISIRLVNRLNNGQATNSRPSNVFPSSQLLQYLQNNSVFGIWGATRSGTSDYIKLAVTADNKLSVDGSATVNLAVEKITGIKFGRYVSGVAVDTTVTQGSSNVVTSGAVYTAIQQGGGGGGGGGSTFTQTLLYDGSWTSGQITLSQSMQNYDDFVVIYNNPSNSTLAWSVSSLIIKDLLINSSSSIPVSLFGEASRKFSFYRVDDTHLGVESRDTYAIRRIYGRKY